MAYRGRLIHPLTCEIARLNTDATRTASGYDDDFRTVKATFDANGVRTSARVEYTPIKLPCQIEMGRWEAQQQARAGNQPDSRLTLVLHFRDLEDASLVDPATGDALIRVNDRLVALYDRDGTLLEQAVSTAKGGLYATEVQPAGMGIGGRRNLLVVTFDERPQGLTT